MEQSIHELGVSPKFQRSAKGFGFRARMTQMCRKRSRILARSRLLCYLANSLVRDFAHLALFLWN